MQDVQHAHKGMAKPTQPTLEERVQDLAEQITQLCNTLAASREQSPRVCFSVEEVAKRWGVAGGRVRRLIRDKHLKPLRGFRPFRITLDEIRRYEALDDRVDTRALMRGGRRTHS